MRILLHFIFVFIAANGYAVENSYVQSLPNHQLVVTLHPEEHSLEVEDHITVPHGSPSTLYFSLHRELNPTSIDAEVKSMGKMPDPWLWQYSVKPKPGHDTFTIAYSGKLFHPPQQDANEARSFESTRGIIAEEGVVLNGESGWYPRLDTDKNKGMLTFSLEIEQPKKWIAVSQGALISPRGAKMVWRERQPQNEIHLIAGPLKEYSQRGSKVSVYLRNNILSNNNVDEALAQRYLNAGSRYIELYQRLMGPYPYAKFALIENFWETGYGMPSFTLLGSQVIRLPFILDTSYPHEILHNWLGNGVYVDYDKGNWSEGLTAYLADHLFQEQKGYGAEYRNSMLQKYADFVSIDRDFPLSQFTSRNSASSEAVGYGKSMMMFHMLRRVVEDDRFIVGLQNLYKNQQFKQASFADVEEAFSQAAGKNLKPFFKQWTQQVGAPQLRLVSAETAQVNDGYELSVNIEQTQSGSAYILDVPIVVTLEGEENAYSTVIAMTGKQAELRVTLKTQPLRVDVDPEFDLFRRLEAGEMPAAFSQVLGAKELMVVFPRQASEDMRMQYLGIAQAWQQQPSRTMQIKWDDELEKLPSVGAVWLFGWENRFRSEFQNSLDQSAAKLGDAGVEISNKAFSRETDALALTTHIGKTPVAWLAAPDANMLPTLARKLPHYAKYSYAIFNGTVTLNNSAQRKKRSWLDFPAPESDSGLIELNNIAKGMWPVTKSPLTVFVRQADGSVKNVMRGKLSQRSALAH